MTRRKPIDWKQELRYVLLLGLGVVAIWSLVAKPFYIPSESMEPTLLVGDRLVVSKYPYGYSYLSPFVEVLPKMDGRLFGRLPTRGDVVVVKAPATHEDWIKRVIGLPGDTVAMRDGRLILNGVPVPKRRTTPAIVRESPITPCFFAEYRVFRSGEPFCRYPRFIETLPGGRSYQVLDVAFTEADDFGPVGVPAGHVFLMGDNRDRSADSRFAPPVGLGFLPVENIIGRAEFVTFSLNGEQRLLAPASWFEALRPKRAGLSLRHLDRSR